MLPVAGTVAAQQRHQDSRGGLPALQHPSNQRMEAHLVGGIQTSAGTQSAGSEVHIKRSANQEDSPATIKPQNRTVRRETLTESEVRTGMCLHKGGGRVDLGNGC